MAVHIKDTDQSKEDFEEGTLDDVVATDDGLELENEPGLKFDRDDEDYVDLGSSSEFDITDKITLEAWITSDNFERDWGRILSKGYDSSYQLAHYSDNGTLRFRLDFDDDTSEQLESSTIIEDGNWHHICGTYDGNEMKVYVDGEEENSNSVSKTIATDSRAFTIGCVTASDGRSHYISMTANEVRLWDIARTQTEIQNNMNKELNGDETGLVAYYKLNEGEGSTAYDSAGGNDGTINGATWVNPNYTSWNLDGEGTRIIQLDLSPAGEIKSSLIEWQAVPLKNDYYILSGGHDDSNTAIIEINGSNESHSERAMNTVLIRNGDFIESKDFDTYDSESESDALEDYIDSLNTDDILIIAVKDEATNNLTQSCRDTIENKLFSEHIKDLSHRESWLIFSKLGDKAYIEKWSGGEGEGDVETYFSAPQIETRVSFDGGSTWTDWTEPTNGDSIPDLSQDTDVSDGLLECRQVLSTDDASVTPILQNLTIEVNSQKLHEGTPVLSSTADPTFIQPEKTQDVQLSVDSSITQTSLQLSQNIIIGCDPAPQSIVADLSVELPIFSLDLNLEQLFQEEEEYRLSSQTSIEQVMPVKVIEYNLRMDVLHLLMGAWGQAARSDEESADWTEHEPNDKIWSQLERKSTRWSRYGKL